MIWGRAYLDEVQTGFGRTGKWFEKITPEFAGYITLAKAIEAAMALCWPRERLEAFQKGDHGPLCRRPVDQRGGSGDD